MKKHSHSHILIIWLLVLVIVLAAFFCLDRIFLLERKGSIGDHLATLQTLLKEKASAPHQKLGINDVQSIKDWMTFDYIDFVFGLPPTLIQYKLGINDPHYPSISILTYERHHPSNGASLVQQVQDVITNYLSSTTASSTNS